MGRVKADQAARVIRGAETGPDPTPGARRGEGWAGWGGQEWDRGCGRRPGKVISIHDICILFSVSLDSAAATECEAKCNTTHEVKDECLCLTPANAWWCLCFICFK